METLTFQTEEEANAYNAKLHPEKQGQVEVFWQTDDGENEYIIVQVKILCKDGIYREDAIVTKVGHRGRP